jgi:hypothetical protein
MHTFCFRSWAMLPIMISCLSTFAHGQNLSPFPGASLTGVYSNMRYYEDSGDIAGLEIFIVYSINGYYALVQMAEGGPEVPALLPLKVEGDSIQFDYPRGGNVFDVFRGKFVKWGLVGKFESAIKDPISSTTTFRLKKTKSYWQR